MLQSRKWYCRYSSQSGSGMFLSRCTSKPWSSYTWQCSFWATATIRSFCRNFASRIRSFTCHSFFGCLFFQSSRARWPLLPASSSVLPSFEKVER